MTTRLPDGSAGSAAPDPDGVPPEAGSPGPVPDAVAQGRQRRLWPPPGVHRAPRSAARRAALVAVPLLVVGLVAVLLLVRPWAGSDDAADEPDPALAVVAPDVAAWINEEVPADTPVTASGDLRAALADAGVADRLTDEATDGSLQVVDGEPAGDALVLARFEADDGSVLNLVDPSPGEPTPVELEKRRSLAAAVLANPVAGATGHAADVLREGAIDARLLGLLAGLVTRMDVHVADLPPAPGEPADGPLARRLLVDLAGGERLTPGTAATEDVVAFLEAQRPPFAPDRIAQTEEGILVGFDYVSAPDAVVTGATP